MKVVYEEDKEEILISTNQEDEEEYKVKND